MYIDSVVDQINYNFIVKKFHTKTGYQTDVLTTVNLRNFSLCF